MAKSLATKYRPVTLEEICGQTITVEILSRQAEAQNFKNAYLFSGASGVGKTTAARAFSMKINGSLDGNIELDAASNGNIESIRQIVDDATKRSMFCKYKIFIIDECQSISTAGWQVFLKCLEECPTYTIFIFCTTDVSHIPVQVLNRLQRFNFGKLARAEIYNRLLFICDQEHLAAPEEVCDFISKMCNGCMRDAITMLEQCVAYSTELTIDNAKKILGDLSYEAMIAVTNAIIDGDIAGVLQVFNAIVTNNPDLKAFVENYLAFLLDATKYILFKDPEVTNLPKYLFDQGRGQLNIDYMIGIENNLNWFNMFTTKILKLITILRTDNNPRSTIEAYLIMLCRGLDL